MHILHGINTIIRQQWNARHEIEWDITQRYFYLLTFKNKVFSLTKESDARSDEFRDVIKKKVSTLTILRIGRIWNGTSQWQSSFSADIPGDLETPENQRGRELEEWAVPVLLAPLIYSPFLIHQGQCRVQYDFTKEIHLFLSLELWNYIRQFLR